MITSFQVFKGMVYRKGKVFTRQCDYYSYPKDLYYKENVLLTALYNKIGQVNFEKWFLNYGLMRGEALVLKGSNKVLRRLEYLKNLLRNDENYMTLKEREVQAHLKIVSVKSKVDKEIAKKDYNTILKDVEKYISSFYDTHNSKYKDIERER